ncbi:hypothetical protein BP6252_08675 [Coleophoma cylindrospora]|uniref:Uncharacterized protein n=1 Tax=Coleophoma cylindrospora TaxID=1849047 RepID=A0A3D8R6H8_9HELO|nr:hypothetical protein BP6252_08675 [Coleophoma cylindrospora]
MPIIGRTQNFGFMPLPYSEQQPVQMKRAHQPLAFIASPPVLTMPSSRFPQTFVFERSSFSNLVLSSDPDRFKQNQDLFYIATHRASSGKPDLVIHAGPTSSSPELCSARLKYFSSTIDLLVRGQLVELRHTGFWSTAYSFTLPASQYGWPEVFEWKKGSRQEVAVLGAASHGMKLVRSSTGEVVAVYANIRFRLSKKGKMAFVGSGTAGQLGGDWELLALLSLMAILERGRRDSV